MVLVPEIKLIRTDTTLDLSQKAEKVWISLVTKVEIKPIYGLSFGEKGATFLLMQKLVTKSLLGQQ